MDNIKKGSKRIERILLLFGIVGNVVAYHDFPYKSMEGAKFITDVLPLLPWMAFLISICFSPYLVFKLISWIGMGFVDDDKVKK